MRWWRCWFRRFLSLVKEVLSGDDVKFFEEREFYGRLQKKDEEAVVGK